ncbi:SAP domain-containing protein [uncultured Jatrophihabitans sp.]|uniref:SAP domain-containing protein n=1 Tax=uncultured Jatrophihabitans sp. TaxID=1610747 RepID=UPI0035CA81EF
MNDDQVEIYPAHDDLEATAQALLGAAEDAGERPEVVETVHGQNGMGFRLPADLAAKAGYGNADDEAHADSDELTGYDAMTVAELDDEIGARNVDREEADHIPTSGKKADKVAALEADDEAHAE